MNNKNKKKQRTEYCGDKKSFNKRSKFRVPKDDTSNTNADAGYASGTNDIAWYSKHPELLASVSKIPFGWQPGRSVPMGTIAGSVFNVQFTDESAPYYYPGVAALSFSPTVGQSQAIDSPINIAAKELYAKIRSAYSGSLEADAPDLMMYMLALDSLYMLYEDYKRVYYTINNYSYNNHMFPKHLVNAMGYNLDDLQSRKMEFYSFLVEAQAKLKKFLVPDFMPIFNRHSFMAANVYTDAATPKSQLYVFRTAGYYKLANTVSQTKLTSVMRDTENAELFTLDNIRVEFSSALDAMFEWDTAFTINGYFQRAYSDSKFLEPSPVIFDGVLNPVYNELVLYQIKNASINEFATGSNDITYTPEDNCIYCKPTFSANSVGISGGQFGAVYANRKLFSLPGSSQPADDVIVEATRLSTTTRAGFIISDFLDNYIECGTEIVSRITLYDGRGDIMTLSSGDLIIKVEDNKISHIVWTNIKNLLSAASAFNCFPCIRIWEYKYETGEPVGLGTPLVYTSAENVTTINEDDMENLHRVCIYSEFDCFH